MAPSKNLQEEEDDYGWRLSTEQFQKLNSAEWLRTMLRDPSLQRAIRTVDSAVDRECALELAKAGDPRFADFVHKLLVELNVRPEGVVEGKEI